MTDTDKTIPVWVDNEGEKVQVGWATPDNGGVRKINLLEGFENTSLKNVKFGDVESFETTLDPDETQEPPRTFQEFASEPIDAGVAPEDIEPDDTDDEEGFIDTEGDLPYIHDEDLENVDDEDSDETEDLPEGFEPAPAVQEEPTQDEDPAQP